MAIEFDKLQQYFYIDKLIYHSVDLSLYMVSVIIDEHEHYITDNNGNYFKATNLISLQKEFATIEAKETVLRHTTPYDEMIGGPEKDNNLLEVQLKDNNLYWLQSYFDLGDHLSVQRRNFLYLDSINNTNSEK